MGLAESTVDLTAAQCASITRFNNASVDRANTRQLHPGSQNFAERISLELANADQRGHPQYRPSIGNIWQTRCDANRLMPADLYH